jgi:ketosteroid isomerase-like protein
MKDNDDIRIIGDALLHAFTTQKRDDLQAVVQDDIVWRLPGDNKMSGDVVGVDGLLSRFAKLAGYGVTIGIETLAINATGLAITLHNTGSHDGRDLDERLVTTIALREGKVSRLDTYLSDMPMMNAYFV